MPLERIDHHAPARRTRRRWIAICFLGMVLALTGCAEGTRSDASRGQAEDAKRDSIVSDMQATETYLLVNGTPAASPTPPHG